jgi:hypothetical protein
MEKRDGNNERDEIDEISERSGGALTLVGEYLAAVTSLAG